MPFMGHLTHFPRSSWAPTLIMFGQLTGQSLLPSGSAADEGGPLSQGGMAWSQQIKVFRSGFL